jgi:hypothetical protein
LVTERREMAFSRGVGEGGAVIGFLRRSRP